MLIGLRLFISSAVFGIAIAVAYWVTSHEIVGMLLLGIMAFGLSFVAGYMIVAEREADLVGDKKGADMRTGAGELVGTYTIRSPLPLAIAAAIACLALGIVLSPTFAILGLIAVLVIAALFIVQSR